MERQPPSATPDTTDEIPATSDQAALHEPDRVASKIKTLRPPALRDDAPPLTFAPVAKRRRSTVDAPFTQAIDIDRGWEEDMPPSSSPLAVPLPPRTTVPLSATVDANFAAPASGPLVVTLPSAFPWPSVGTPVAAPAMRPLSLLLIMQRRAIGLLRRIASAASGAALLFFTVKSRIFSRKRDEAAARAEKKSR